MPQELKPCVKFSEKDNALHILTPSAYAVAMSALTHGLRRARYSSEISEEIGDANLKAARDFREENISSHNPELPFVLPAYAAHVIVHGLRGEYVTAGPNIPPKVRVLHQRVGNQIQASFQDLQSASGQSDQTML